MLNSSGFDLWADGYDNSVGLSDEENTYPFAGYKKVLNEIYKEILTHTEVDVRVLDIGFGTGVLTTKLYEKECHIFRMDFSSRMIELAKEKMPNATLVQGDFSQGIAEELRHQTYDYIIATYSLHHLTDERKVTFIKSLLSLLKENGKVIIGDIAFEDRSHLERCKEASKEEWDDDEVYFVYREIEQYFTGTVIYKQLSFCAGVLEFTK